MNNEQQKRVEEIRARINSYDHRLLFADYSDFGFLLDLLREQQAELEQTKQASDYWESIVATERELLTKPERVNELLTQQQAELDEARKTAREWRAEALANHRRATQNWHASPAFGTFVELKHGRVGQILVMLQDGQISRGRACEALAELAHGTAPDDVRLPEAKDAVFSEDEFPCEAYQRQQAELEALRKAVNLTLGFMDCCDWNDEDSERDAARVVSVCRDAARAASEPQA